MSSAIARCSVLAVSGAGPGAGKLLALLGSFRFGRLAAAVSASQARRELIAFRPDLVVIDAPLPDESGIALASDLACANICGVIVLAERSVYESVMCRVEDDGVLTIKKPTASGDLYQACILLAATQLKLRQLDQRAPSLQEKMEELRLVNRAKWLLMDRLKMTESEAHRYLEKQAMDACVKRRIIAEQIIGRFQICAES